METLVKEIPLETAMEIAALNIVESLEKAGFSAFFVGGYVRDKILGSASNDIDIATDAKPDQVENLFDRTIAIGASFGVITVLVGDFSFEVATFREEAEYSDGRRPDKVVFANAEADAERRDFTINALFYSPTEKKVIDFSTGLADLEQGVIRTVGEAYERFSEDYLRMLRAVRFAARFNFPLEESVVNAIKVLALNIKNVSVERIFTEVTKMLTGNSPDLAIKMLYEVNLLDHIFPEISALVGCEQPVQWHPEGDAWEHTLLALKNMPEKPSAELAWSVLLHDVGKPVTLTYREDGTPTMPGHASVGARMVDKMLQVLKTSSKLRENVTEAVKNHMTFSDVQRMRPAKLRRFMARDTFAMELELHKIDCLSASGKLDNYEFLVEKQKEFIAAGKEIVPPALLSGKDLIELGFKPGPNFKEIMSEVEEKQLNSELNSSAEAIAWVKENYGK